MKFNIINVSGGEFKNDDGDKIAFGSVHVIDSEITKRDGFAGQEVKKIRCSPELIHHIKDTVPNYYECDIEIIGKDSKVKIVSAKLIEAKK